MRPLNKQKQTKDFDAVKGWRLQPGRKKSWQTFHTTVYAPEKLLKRVTS